MPGDSGLQPALCWAPAGEAERGWGRLSGERRKDWGELLLPGEEPRRGCSSVETHYFSSQLAAGELSHSLFFLSFFDSPSFPPLKGNRTVSL